MIEGCGSTDSGPQIEQSFSLSVADTLQPSALQKLYSSFCKSGSVIGFQLLAGVKITETDLTVEDSHLTGRQNRRSTVL